MCKKTLDNCKVFKEAVSLGVGLPEQYEGQCEGYAGEDMDEPITRCKMCELNTTNN